jgi:hypothetical protein
MRYRKLDSNGDMVFGNQQADFYRDKPEAVAQAVWTRLRLWVGEWFIDVTEGTPYQQAALGTNKSKTIEPAIRARILGTEGVTSIESFDMIVDPDNRVTSIYAVINTAYGSAQLQGVL